MFPDCKVGELIKARIYNVTFSCLSCLSRIITGAGGDQGLLGVLGALSAVLVAVVAILGVGAVQRQFIARCCGVVSEDPQGPPLLFAWNWGRCPCNVRLPSVVIS